MLRKPPSFSDSHGTHPKSEHQIRQRPHSATGFLAPVVQGLPDTCWWREESLPPFAPDSFLPSSRLDPPNIRDRCPPTRAFGPCGWRSQRTKRHWDPSAEGTLESAFAEDEAPPIPELEGKHLL